MISETLPESPWDGSAPLTWASVSCVSRGSESMTYCGEPVLSVLKIHEKVGAGTFSSVYRATLEADGCRERQFAVKRLFRTNGLTRIRDEISLLRALHGSPRMPRIEGIIRVAEQVHIVAPFYEHESFRHLIVEMTLDDMVEYMKRLLEALAVLEQNGIIHRDVKPGNFLFHRRYAEQAVLVDFGLAQRQTHAMIAHASQNVELEAGKLVIRNAPPMFYKTRQARAPRDRPPRSDLKRPIESTQSAAMDRLNEPMDQRRFRSASSGTKRSYVIPMNAPRAGTRGFRAPEVLFRSHQQSTRVDVWSAGVIFLSMLSCRYPFFRTNDDRDCLAELEQILGTAAMQEAAGACGRRVFFPYFFAPMNFRNLCERLRKKRARNYQEAGSLPDKAFDLLSRLLDPVWYRRISATEALKHPLFRREKQPA